ncbi:MAG: hypothetical protein IJO52_06940, partial [Clostridia bacterium]|nr:hypothetical protein [Clostridia bacterium]
IEIMRACEDKTEQTKKLLNLGEYIYRCVNTAINTKRHYILKQKLNIAATHEAASKLIDEVEALLFEEKENVLAAIPLVQYDSILGWEPSMEYVADEKGLRWKLRQLEHELSVIIPKFRKANSLIDKY